MIKVKIYTKEHCPACMMTKKLFNKLDVDYKEVTVLQDSPMLEVLREQGWHS
ncbi:NrdH-redoxin, partial [Limosilactobacillus reuteri]